MGLLTKNKKYALWAYSQTINIYMPYGPTQKEQKYALWAYSQTINIYMPYGPTCITE